MKILLIYPQYSHSNEFDSRAPSMSLVYLASSLERSGHKVVIYDASLGPIMKTEGVYRYGAADEEVRGFISNNNFDLVGITCSFTGRWKYAVKIAQQVKEVSPLAPVAVGGLFATSEWKYCLNNCKAVDFAMLGESELSFAQIANNISRGATISDACKDVEGVAWREGQGFFCNPRIGYNNKLDDLPFPSWHLVDLKRYFSLQRRIFELETPCLPVLSSRSCPNRCRFCNMFITHGSRWRSRSAANVLDEIEYLIRRFSVRNLYFIDDNFSLDLERAKSICRGIIERGLSIHYNFHNGLSIKTIDFELVKLLKESGCTSVCLAIESGSERMRNKVYGKRLSTEKIIEVIRWFKKAGIPSIGYFMVGGPGETRQDFQMSKTLLKSLPLSFITVNIFTPHPGTELYDECKEKGWLIECLPEEENRVEMFSPMLKTPDFTPQDIINWQKELYFSFIKYHWLALAREAFRPRGLVNLDMIGKFLGLIKFHSKNNNQSCNGKLDRINENRSVK